MNDTHETKRTFTVTLPKANLELVILILMVIVTGFQTVELLRLKTLGATRQTTVQPTAAAAPASAAGLEQMVGGC